ncbi:MAG: putative transposase [Acidimicrobiales bacterium]
MPDVVVERPALFEVASGPGRRIGKRLTLLDSDGSRAVFFGPTAIHVYDIADKEAESVAMAMLSRAGLATDVDIAAGFGVHRNTVGRIVSRFERDGLAGVVRAKRGPKGPSKVTPAVMEIVAANASLSPRELRERIRRDSAVELSVAYVYELAVKYRAHQLRLGEGEVVNGAQLPVPAATEAEEAQDGAVDHGADDHGRLDEDPDSVDEPDHQVTEASDDDGDGDEQDGVFDPPVSLPRAVSGRYMGLALYYPALAAVGLVDVARALFALPRSERFGVRATTLCLFFMTILSKTTIETAKHLRRLEFGAMVGSGRAPCVKTLRRKLAELVAQGKAGELGVALARRFVDVGLVATAYLYVDGHMKAYSGGKRLQEVWNSQRRMPLPGIHTYFVGDNQGRPLLFLTEECSTNLAKAMPAVVAAIREVIGDRRFTVIFDRGGYDGKLFSWLVANNVDFITYQKGTPSLAKEAFSRREARFEGARVRFMIATDQVKVGKTGPWRRVVVRVNDAHQTPILTSLPPGFGAARIACLMFARWRQENLFKYMGTHHGLDDIVSYAGEPADPDVLVPNPARKAIDKRIAEVRKALNAAKSELGKAVLDEPKVGGRSAHGLKIAQGGKVGAMRDLEAQIEALVAERKTLPTRVSIAASGLGREVMAREAKAIVDRIKIAAYNAEEWLLDRLVVHYRNPNDVRDLLRAFAELSGTIDTTMEHDDHGGISPTGVVVSLDPPDTPAHRQALRGLVGDLNAAGAVFPGTDLPVAYEVRMHHSERAA